MILRLLAMAILIVSVGRASLAQETGQALLEDVQRPYTGDYDGMKKGKAVRVLIPYSITDYYLEGGQEKGLAVEYLREFEKRLNKGIKKEIDKIRVVLLPTSRGDLIPYLLEGRGDIVVANLTITPERQKQVDFSEPYRSDVREVVVTGKDHGEIKTPEALAGLEIHTRRSSSYFESLVKLSGDLEGSGLEPVKAVESDEALEDEDLLEMLNAGIIPATVVDEYKADLWLPLFENIKVHRTVGIREGADIAWAFRKDSPQLKQVIDDFVAETRIGTKLGNIFAKRYSSDISKIVNPKAEDYHERLNELLSLFEAVGNKYNIDPMLLAAQAFQESRFDNKAKSRVGAVGIMQVLPSTARDRNVGIKNFRELDGNVEAGAKYNRFVADHYFSDPEITELQKILFVLASYNAGPNRVARVRAKAEDPNTWFDHVEWQVAKAAGSEPVKYVKNIYIYYLVFSQLTEYERQRERLLEKD